ncbi:MAG: membrane protein insertion efficiency factor YidD [Clostridia bacterium]|nr:membrane protein insertion efficiency factor YidD [Clostridia bacterium]
MKKISIFLLRFYKKRISPIFSFMGIHCKYYPTCSEYMRQAIEKYGFFKGFWLGVWRFLRCNPFSKGGYDPLK